MKRNHPKPKKKTAVSEAPAPVQQAPVRQEVPQPAIPAPVQQPSKPVSPRPHWITILITVFSPLIALLAAAIAYKSLNTSQRSMEVGQRAYLTYQVSVINSKEIVDDLRADKDFFMTYQITIANVGNTPADSILPKINVARDPDRSPVMISSPNLEAFELGPKESRILSGQALFKHFNNVRKLPGLTTGLTGDIQYRDVFQEPQVKHVCYSFVISGDTASGGMCGTIMQFWAIK